MSVSGTFAREVVIPPAGIVGDLTLPPKATGIVVFAHGSGSGRHSSRNQYVAKVLQDRGLGTLLLDLLTEEEERVDLRTMQLRFDIGLLASRVRDAAVYIRSLAALRDFSIGLFGASTGAAAALVAAAELPEVEAIVSRGGRPDLAGPALSRVTAPVLLIVGGQDPQVLKLNEAAMQELQGPKHLMIVPGAGHLFEERGALEQVAQLAAVWFLRYLRAGWQAISAQGSAFSSKP
jgi:pimeloyl-ACP methyl ester carboxylesterase